MNFEEALNIVRGAVAEKDLVPVLTHFHIYKGRIQGGNGRVSIDADISILEDADPITIPAAKFLKAMESLGENWSLHWEDDSLIVESGATKFVLPLSTQDYPVVEVEGRYRVIRQPMLAVFKRLLPFVGKDASRPELCSILIINGRAYAANNPVVARIPLDIPDMSIPVFMVDELLRIGLEPTGFQLDDKHLTFRLSKDAWIQSALWTGDWPDVEKFFPPCKIKKIQYGDAIAAALMTVQPFCQDEKFPVVHFSKKGVQTEEGPATASVGDLALPDGYWNIKILSSVLEEATHFNFQDWPEACRWSGDHIEGITIGIRK